MVKTKLKSRQKTKVKSEQRTSTKKTQIKQHPKYYIISECLNPKHSDLLTTQLRTYLKSYGLVEYMKIKDYDQKLLKRHNLDTNCDKQVQLTKRTKFPAYITNQHVDFIWLNPIGKITDKRFYGISANLINMLNQDRISIIDDKAAIYTNMHTYCPQIAQKHLARTFYINDTKQYNFTNNQHYILRPVDSFAGRDILYISNQKELNDAIEYYKTHKNYRGITYNNNVIASEYIINPLLFNGLKFHMRVYYLISYIKGNCSTFILNIGDIIHAKEPYTTDKPFTKAIHDTHQGSSEDYFWPTDLPTNIKKLYPDIFTQIKTILKCITQIITNTDIKQKWLYPEHKNGFLVMGADFMMDESGTVYLIEVNNKPGYTYNKRENNIKFSKLLFDWINESVVEPYFLNKPQLAKQHKTYLAG